MSEFDKFLRFIGCSVVIQGHIVINFLIPVGVVPPSICIMSIMHIMGIMSPGNNGYHV